MSEHSLMQRILLTQGQFAIVDSFNYQWLSQWNWFVIKTGRLCYAGRWKVEHGVQYLILMHRQILGLIKGDGKKVDHKDGDGLNNVVNNIRICTQAQNCRNRHVILGVSKYKGVCWDKSRNQWMAHIRKNGRMCTLGRFADEIEAARAYDRAAIEYFGEYACTNFPRSDYG